MALSSAVRGLLLGLVVAGSVLIATKAPTIVATPAPVQISVMAAPAANAEAAVAERVAPEARGRSVVVASAPTPAEAPVAPTQPPAVPADAAPPAARACPSSFFCYPRLGIAGAIVDYDDCSGATDVGVAVRQLTCVREGIWLAAHAYTQFGRITGFQVGDEVFVRGLRFVITGSSIQRSCAPTTQAVAPLSLQTSLESATCGRVLVVQGR